MPRFLIEIKHDIQGKNLLAYYDDDNSYPDRYLFTQSLEPTKYDANPLLGVVKDQYKYIQYVDLEGMNELYDLAQDPYELKNVIDDERYAQALQEMQAELARLLEITS